MNCSNCPRRGLPESLLAVCVCSRGCAGPNMPAQEEADRQITPHTQAVSVTMNHESSRTSCESHSVKCSGLETEKQGQYCGILFTHHLVLGCVWRRGTVPAEVGNAETDHTLSAAKTTPAQHPASCPLPQSAARCLLLPVGSNHPTSCPRQQAAPG